MKPRSALGLVALLATVVLFPAGCGNATGTTSPEPAQTTTSATVSTEAQLSAEDQAMLAEIRALHDDWKSGRIEIDWPPPGIDTAEAPYPADLEELFQWVERGVFTPQVTVWLKDEAGAAEELRAEIAGWPEVIGVQFISKDEALARLRADLADHPEVLEDLQGNPLPASIEITVDDSAVAPTVGERLQGRPEVDEVRWAERRYAYEGIVFWLKSRRAGQAREPRGPPRPRA